MASHGLTCSPNFLLFLCVYILLLVTCDVLARKTVVCLNYSQWEQIRVSESGSLTNHSWNKLQVPQFWGILVCSKLEINDCHFPFWHRKEEIWGEENMGTKFTQNDSSYDISELVQRLSWWFHRHLETQSCELLQPIRLNRSGIIEKHILLSTSDQGLMGGCSSWKIIMAW